MASEALSRAAETRLRDPPRAPAQARPGAQHPPRAPATSLRSKGTSWWLGRKAHQTPMRALGPTATGELPEDTANAQGKADLKEERKAPHGCLREQPVQRP